MREEIKEPLTLLLLAATGLFLFLVAGCGRGPEPERTIVPTHQFGAVDIDGAAVLCRVSSDGRVSCSRFAAQPED